MVTAGQLALDLPGYLDPGLPDPDEDEDEEY
jgi:hypothetical protein